MLFSLLTGSVSLTEPSGKEKLLGYLCCCRIVPSGKLRILPWISSENSQVDTQGFPKNLSQCTTSTARITSLHTHLCGNYRNGWKMSKRHWARVLLWPYPVLPVHVGGHLFLKGCNFLCASLSRSLKISDHYRLVQTATKCSVNQPFWLEKHLCEGASVTLRIQGTGALVLTHHLLVSVPVSSLCK